MSIRYTTVASPIGELLLAEDADGRLVACWFADGEKPERTVPEPWHLDAGAAADAAEQLEAYFAGERQDFSLPLAPQGTAFQLEVWRALETIPFGQTWSYGRLAEAVGRPGAARAVGGANHWNPLALIVPCHRVIGSSGTLVGYGGGLDRKRWLLDHERAVLEGRQRLPL